MYCWIGVQPLVSEGGGKKKVLDPKMLGLSSRALPLGGKKRAHGVSQKACKIISKSQTRPQTIKSRKVDCARHAMNFDYHVLNVGLLCLRAAKATKQLQLLKICLLAVKVWLVLDVDCNHAR